MLSIFFRSWILRSYYLSSEKEKENPRLLSTSSIKREIGKFHVGVVQRSTAKKWTKLLFCQSILPFSLPPPSSLLKLSDVFLKRPLKKVLWKLRSPRGYFRKFSLSAGVQNSGNVFQSNVSFLFLFLLGIWYSPSQPFLGCHETLSLYQTLLVWILLAQTRQNSQTSPRSRYFPELLRTTPSLLLNWVGDELRFANFTFFESSSPDFLSLD